MHETNIIDSIKQFDPWWLLIRAHDHVWQDKGWPFYVRYQVCQLLWRLSWPG